MAGGQEEDTNAKLDRLFEVLSALVVSQNLLVLSQNQMILSQNQMIDSVEELIDSQDQTSEKVEELIGAQNGLAIAHRTSTWSLSTDMGHLIEDSVRNRVGLLKGTTLKAAD